MGGVLRRTGAVLVVLATLGVATGCGSGSDVTPEQWTDRMCGAVLPFVRSATTPPPQGTDPAATAREISGYLGRSVTALDQALAGVEQIGPAPVDDGEAVATQVRDSLTGIRSAFATARGQVDALQADPATIEAKLPEALTPVSRLGQATGPLDPVVRNQQLGEAARSSATCRELGEAARAAQRTGSGPDVAPGGPPADGGQGGGN